MVSILSKIPDEILGKRPTTPEEFAKQQDRIAAWVLDQQTKDIEKHANEGGKK